MEAELISPLVSMTTAREPLVNALSHVFGFAFAPCNLHREGKFLPRALSLAEKYLARLRALNADPVKLLAEANKGEVEREDEDEDEEKAFLRRPSRSGVGVMLYAVYAESVAPDVVPRDAIPCCREFLV